MKMKRVTCMVLCCVLLIGTVFVPAQANAYPILSDWAKEDAYKAEAAGLFIRGQQLHDDLRAHGSRHHSVSFAVQLAEKMTGAEIENTSSGVFQDMIGRYSRDFAEKAYSAGISNGCGSGRFQPSDFVTREQYICMLYRTLLYVEKELDVELFSDIPASSSFQDLDAVSDWAKESVQNLEAIGVVKGKSDHCFCPKDIVSFEEMLVLSYRCYLLLNE